MEVLSVGRYPEFLPFLPGKVGRNSHKIRTRSRYKRQPLKAVREDSCVAVESYIDAVGDESRFFLTLLYPGHSDEVHLSDHSVKLFRQIEVPFAAALIYSQLADKIISASHRYHAENCVIVTVHAVRDFLNGAVSAAGENDYIIPGHCRLFSKQSGKICGICLASRVVQFDVSVRIALDELLDICSYTSVVFSLSRNRIDYESIFHFTLFPLVHLYCRI